MLVAMERFWRDGYEQTTVAKLTEAMGIAAPSLYAAFGDKDQLFQTAARHYFATISARFDAVLALPTFQQSIEEMLRLSAQAHTDAGTPAGCFMATEPRLADYRTSLRDRLTQRAERGIAEGDLPAGTDARQLADYVMAVHSGMSSRARDGGTTAEVMAIAEVALAALPQHG
jgi:AcrR family transcriptional regulator